MLSMVPHSKEVRPLNRPESQIAVFVGTRLRSKGKRLEKIVGIVVGSSPPCAFDSGRRCRTLRFGTGPREVINGASRAE